MMASGDEIMTRFLTVCVGAIALLHPSPAHAQATTGDGVQALVRGDKQAALQILRPLAEGSQEDPIAQFFLATIYESSPGGPVPAQVRACGLYVSAAQRANPFMSQALALAQAIQESMGALAQKFCTRDPAIVGSGESLAAAPAVPLNAAPTGPSAEAVSAYVRGDYTTAAALLQPIAARTFSRDYSAEFLLASLYDNGFGVTRDWMRACALYLRSADEGVFQMQAVTLWRTVRKRLTPSDADACTRLSKLGFGSEFQPLTFTLAPGHSIAWSIDGATITYQGREKHVHNDMFDLRGIRFLPIQHTEVAVGLNRTERRHFIEVFTWIPQGPGQWNLMWQLFEVVRDDLTEITRNALTTVAAHEPPAGPPFDVRSFVRIGVTPNGEAELATLGGDHPGTVLIETEAERQEAKARKAALNAPVDWKATGDLHRPPSFSYPVAVGCVGVFLYAPSKDRMEALTVRIADDLLSSRGPQTFDLAAQYNRIEAAVHVFAQPIGNWPYCTDVRVGEPPPEQTWRAVSGTIRIERSRIRAGVNSRARERVTITIEGAVFSSPDGVRVTQLQPIVLTAILQGPFG